MDKTKKSSKKKKVVLIVLLSLFAIIAGVVMIFTHFGGFGTGPSVNPEEFAAYAENVTDITVADNVRIVGLGEATHGNAEFQQLKLEVFRHLVENEGVRAFALEGDYGGCEAVNRYIHGGEGTAEEAAAAIGFALYRTDEMADLIVYMRSYNDTAAAGDDVRFYGFDMQRCIYSYNFLVDDCKALDIDTAELESLVDGSDWSAQYDYPARVECLEKYRDELVLKEGAAQTIHYVDVLLQFCEINSAVDADYIEIRDRMMAENTLWILEQEELLGHSRIFVTGHNGHVAKYGSYDSMGKLLDKELGDDYFAIGTDFYKTRCNLPKSNGGRTKQVFYSYDPLAKAAKKAGLEICYMDFDKAANSPELAATMTDYVYMGSLGEGYNLLIRTIPYSYRIFQPPAELYDGMIFVTNAHPTEIKD